MKFSITQNLVLKYGHLPVYILQKTSGEHLDTLAESLLYSVSCGGELSSPDKIQLMYESKDGGLHKRSQ